MLIDRPTLCFASLVIQVPSVVGQSVVRLGHSLVSQGHLTCYSMSYEEQLADGMSQYSDDDPQHVVCRWSSIHTVMCRLTKDSE